MAFKDKIDKATVALSERFKLPGKPTIRENQWGNWYGYEGGRKTEHFFDDIEGSQEEKAKRWLAEKNATRNRRILMAEHEKEARRCKAEFLNYGKGQTEDGIYSTTTKGGLSTDLVGGIAIHQWS